MPGGHDPRRTIEHHPEIIGLAQFGFTGGQPHSHRQVQLPLCSHRSFHGGAGRGEGRTDTVAGVLEHEAAVGLDRVVQYLVMSAQSGAHRSGVSLPPTGGALDIGEEERHHSRRSSGRRSRHIGRIS